MAKDWYRSGSWTSDEQAEFEHRLSRARPHNRPQYLAIKGGALFRAGEVDAARELWGRVLDDPQSSWVDHASVTEQLADSYYAESPELAAQYFRKVSELSPTLSGTSGTHQIRLAQLLLDTGSPADLAEVGELLSTWINEADSPMPEDHFIWSIAHIKWAIAWGDGESARAGALRALELASLGPVFVQHPTVGLVQADESTLAWLRSLAT